VGEHVDLVLSGVGKSNAAGAVARVLDASRHGLVLNIGVAGSLPGPDGMAPLSSIHIASSCIFADEGLETPEGFMDCGQMGFPLVEQLGRAIPTDPSIARTLAPLGKVGPIATVSTCSGTDALARQVVKRTGALVEAMEGAAAALVARRLGVPMAEVRVISNTTGDRKAQRWEMSDALATLAQVIGQMLGTPR
jgi:futalosine hydrolase